MITTAMLNKTSTGRSYGTVLAAIFVFVMVNPGPTEAFGQWEQIHKMTADDATQGDHFGHSVGISGQIAIVGAWRDGDAGEHSGSAYLLDAWTGEQLHKLLADDGETHDHFGYSVAISGDIALVGAPGDDDGSGSVYLFDVSTGRQLDKLMANDGAAYDAFGLSVALDGSIAIIGAFSDKDACPPIPGCNSGSAYVFDVTTGEQLFKLTAEDAKKDDFFGLTVAISGDIAIIGAPGNDDVGNISGSAYLFSVTTGQQLHKLTADDARKGDFFGYSVAISGDIVIIGAIGDDDGGNEAGSAYLFDVTTGQQLHKLTANDPAKFDGYAFSVGISDDIAIVGAWADDDSGSQSGSAYLYDVVTGQQFQKLTASDAAEESSFGFSVALGGDVAVIGAVRDDDECPKDWECNSGSAYVFAQSLPLLDLNGDDVVNAADLGLLLGAWGPNAGHPADFNGDGLVDAADLALLLDGWG